MKSVKIKLTVRYKIGEDATMILSVLGIRVEFSILNPCVARITNFTQPQGWLCKISYSISYQL